MTDAERIRLLTNIACRAESQFRHYADLHDRKGTAESAEKAKVNRELADDIAKVLADTATTTGEG